MEIPYFKLSPDVLRGIISEFVLREGTDYGHKEYTLDDKIALVMRQLESGKAKIVYDQKSESCDIVPTSTTC